MNDQTPGLDGRTKTTMIALVVALIASVGIAAVVFATTSKTTKKAVGLNGAALPQGLDKRAAPRITGTDAQGRRVDTAALAGKPYAVTFLYTSCPDVCPLIGEEIHEALQQLGPRAASTAVVAVSVDPRGDTAEAVKLWLRRHREPSNFHYVIGTKQQLTPIWKSYFVSPQVADRPQLSSHTASLWLVDPRGRLRADYPAGGVVAPADLVHDLEALQGGA
jgi:protein SCO1/2